MGWTTTNDPDRFLAAAEDFLQSRPVENSVLLTVCDTLRRRGLTAYGPRPPVMGWWRPATGGAPAGTLAGAVQAAFVQTPPHPPMLSRGPDAAARELARQWTGEPLAEARGDHEAVTAFADAWCARTGTRRHIAARTRVHALGELTPRRPGPPGAAGTAVAADRDLLLRWSREMAAEIGIPLPGGDAVVDDVIAHGGRALWRTPDGEAVAMAGRSVEIRGAIRVVAVYTPPEHRGKGYAGAAVTAVSQAALDAGARHVLLVTDLANPVSNGLYRRLGYRPVRDSLHVAFTAAGAAEAGPST